MILAIFVRSLYTGTGGAEKQAILLLKCLAGEHDIHFIVFKAVKVHPKYVAALKSTPVRTHYLRGNLLIRLIDLFFILRRNKIHAILSYLPVNNFWGAVIGRLSGVKVIVGGIRSSRFEKHRLILLRFIHNYLSDYTIFNNHRGYESLVRAGFRKEKALVIPNGILMEDKVLPRKEKGSITILTVGRFVPAKDYLTAIRAIRFLLDNYNLNSYQLIFQIIGYGNMKETINALISDYCLEGIASVIIRPENVKDFYDNADIYLCSSNYEGISNSILEAMMSGLPIVATDAGDNDKLVIDGESGYIVEAQDYKSIAGRLYDLIVSYEKRRVFGLRGYGHCLENYSSEALHQAYSKFLKSIEHNR